MILEMDIPQFWLPDTPAMEDQTLALNLLELVFIQRKVEKLVLLYKGECL